MNSPAPEDRRYAETPDWRGPATHDQTPKPRILQYRNRRHSIRLEPVFWQALENMAERAGMRIGRFVGELAHHYQGRNFASHLRALALLEAQQRLTLQALGKAETAFRDVLHAAPAPGLLLSRNRTILDHNPAFSAWLGGNGEGLTGAQLTDVIQVRSNAPLNEVWRKLVAGWMARAEVRVLHVAPGRARAASGTVVGLPPRDGREFHAVLWLSAETSAKS